MEGIHIMKAEQIAAVKQEIESFSSKAIQYASDDPDLSAHYNRLYAASQALLTRADRLEKAEARKKHAAARKAAADARKNKKQGTPASPAR
jgi:hypothetical protein